MVDNIKIRLFCEDSLSGKKEVSLKRNQTHYLKDVMRCRVGAKILLFDGSSGEYKSEITHIDRKITNLKILKRTQPLETPADVWMIFCPLKKQRTDFLVEKCTELGVKKFLPTISENTETKRISVKRLRVQAIEAVEQCGGNFVPEILPIELFHKLVESFPEDRNIIFCDETLESESIQNALNKFNSEKVGIFVGPEGGFTNRERKILRKHSAGIGISLGKRILRAETAAISALSYWHSLIGDWKN